MSKVWHILQIKLKNYNEKKKGNNKDQNINKWDGDQKKIHRKKSVKPKAASLKKKGEKIDPYPDSSRKKEKKTQVNEIKKEREEVTAETMEIQRIVREYYESYMLTNWITWEK